MAVQNSTFKTAHVMDNEIVKANDFEFAFENIIDNVCKFAQMCMESTQDFVINGKVTPLSGLTVQVAPIFGICKSTGQAFGRTEKTDETIAFTSSSSGRIDILEVKGDWEEFDNQQRAFNDPDTDIQTYQYVNTKKLFKPVYKIKKGTEGGSVAPGVDEGYVKLAEIHIRANASSITANDIKNITADIAGVNNTGWTTEKAITYNIGYISSINERFRVQHNADGTHKDDVINTDSLDIGVNAKQVNGTVLPIGNSVSIPDETVSTTDSIQSVIVKIATIITSLYDAYLKYGNFKFNGVLSISNRIQNNTLRKPFTLESIGNGTVTFKIDTVTVLTLYENGRLVTNGYTPTLDNDIITKKNLDTVSARLTNLYDIVNAISDALSLDVPEYANEVISSERFHVDNTVEIFAATTENITLSGYNVIDGEYPSDTDLILVKNQTDSCENGIYVADSTTQGWYRAPGYTKPSDYIGKIFKINNGNQQAGKMFYMTRTEFETPSGFYPNEEPYPFKEYFGSVEDIPNKAVIRDENGLIHGSIENANTLENKSWGDTALFGVYCNRDFLKLSGRWTVVLNDSELNNIPNLTAGQVLHITFAKSLQSTENITSVYIRYKGTDYPIGGLQSTRLNYQNINNPTIFYADYCAFLQNTRFVLMFTGSAFLIMNNPILIGYYNPTEQHGFKVPYQGFNEEWKFNEFNPGSDVNNQTFLHINDTTKVMEVLEKKLFYIPK